MVPNTSQHEFLSQGGWAQTLKVGGRAQSRTAAPPCREEPAEVVLDVSLGKCFGQVQDTMKRLRLLGVLGRYYICLLYILII